MTDRPTLSTEERKAILDREIANQVQRGWKMVHSTDTTAQLSKKTGPNMIIALLLLLIMILPGLLYLIFVSGEKTLYIEVDEAGNIQRTEK